MKTNSRTDKINNEILKEVSILIRTGIKDPRVSSLTSVTDVKTTTDLKFCTIYVSVLGSDKEKEETLKGLRQASGFVRKQLAQKINLRATPEIKFEIDNTFEKSMRINELLNEIKK